jgi:SNF2 family DNA or RNA helicase
MLQLIREEFPDALYLDGSTGAEKRGELVRAFQEDPNCSLFLLSLKAGGVGLNLTAADYVFLFDPWWNEAVERQAIDRAHRIGQKKTVIAKRYLAVGTIEEKMLQLKNKKQQAADQLLDLEGWTHEELLHLLI